MNRKIRAYTCILLCGLCLFAMTNKVEAASSQNAADVGGLGEWYVFSMQGEDAAYAKALLKALEEDTVTKNAVTRQKIALAGLAVLDCEMYPKFAAYIEDVMENTIGKLGLMSWVFGLHLLNNGQETTAYTQEQVISTILALQQENGSWAIVGSRPDVDATAMALCALAPHRGQEDVHAAIDRALIFLEEAQQSDGSFQNYGVSNAESCAQVGIALVCLDISPEDARFTKNGQSVWDALDTFYTENGYKHEQDGDVNAMATAQAVCATETLRTGRSPFQVVPRFVEDIQTQTPETPDKVSYRVPLTIGLTVAALGVLVILYIKKKRAMRHFLPVILVLVLAVTLVWVVQIQSADEYVQEVLNPEEIIGSVVVSVEGKREGGFSIEEGATALSVLRMAGVKWNIPITISNSGYVSEIDGLAEFDKGPLSGWKYKVNGTFPSVGADDYVLMPGDRIEWVYVEDVD